MGCNALINDLRAKSREGEYTKQSWSQGSMQAMVLSTCALIAVSLILASCSGGSKRASAPKPSYAYGSNDRPSYLRKNSSIPLGGGVRKLGKTYKVLGRWYTPKHQPNYDAVGVASWYGPKFHGKKTANGEIFDMHNLTAAHKTLPMPSYIRVTNIQNGRSLVLRLNDRGPYAHERLLDLSKRSAQLLGVIGRGTARVRVQYLGPAPLDGNQARERAYLARQPWFRTRYSEKSFKDGQWTKSALGGPRRD